MGRESSGRTDVVLHLERKDVGQSESWRDAPMSAAGSVRAARCQMVLRENELRVAVAGGSG
jgi:hypothetical protein